jgi:hypothetical protein
MVEQEHLDEMESEMGVDELQDMMDKAGLGDLRAENFEDSEIDEAALEQDLMALGNMFADGDLMSGEDVNIRMSSVQFVTGGEVNMNQSAALNVAAESAKLQMSAAALARAEDLTLDRSLSWVAIGNQVSSKNSIAGIVLGRSINGDVRALLDWRGALMFGLGLSAGFSTFRMIRRGIRALSRRS